MSISFEADDGGKGFKQMELGQSRFVTNLAPSPPSSWSSAHVLGEAVQISTPSPSLSLFGDLDRLEAQRDGE